KRVDQQSRVKNLREVDSKHGRFSAYRSRDRDGITAAGGNSKVERVDLVSKLLAICPGAQERADLSRVCRAAAGARYFERGACLGSGRHQISARRRAALIAHLTHAHVSRLGLCGGCAKAQAETKNDR